MKMASPEEMAQTMRNNVPDKTGKSLQEWFEILSSSELKKHGQIVKFLKEQHGVTHGFANLIASDFLQQQVAADPQEDLLTSQYSGDKQAMKAIYDAIIDKLTELADMEISLKKTYVSLRRNKQFALIQPSTKTRLDVGINLKGEPPTARLESAGSFNTMVSHRVRVTELSQVDDELLNWLKQAYDRS
jgi:hypothetical protein